MTYQTVTIGAFTFTNVEMQNPQFLAAIQAGKLLGINRASLFTWGAHGLTPIMFRGNLIGASGKTDLWSLIGELESKTVKRLKMDILNGVDIFGYVQNVTPTDKAGWTQDGNYNYPVQVTFQAGMRSNQGDRGLTYGVVQEADTFSLTGDVVVPNPVGSASPSETVDFTRYADDGAAGTLSIPCALTPDQSRIIYTVASEANLEKGLVTISRLDDPVQRWVLSNGLVKIQTRHGQAGTKGYVEFYYYDGAAWILVAYIHLCVGVTSAATEYPTGTNLPAEAFTLFSSDPERQGLRLKYPATASGYECTLEFELQRGSPMMKVTAENNCSTDLGYAAYILDLVPVSFRYWTRNGTERDAQAGVYGNELQAGDTDTVNVEWGATTAGAPAAATILTGFIRKKKADVDHVGVDAGNYWSWIEERFDNVVIKRGYTFEPVWLFAGRYDKIGSRTPAQLGLEALARTTIHQGVIPRT